jgi:hypothetical protein
MMSLQLIHAVERGKSVSDFAVGRAACSRSVVNRLTVTAIALFEDILGHPFFLTPVSCPSKSGASRKWADKIEIFIPFRFWQAAYTSNGLCKVLWVKLNPA